MSLKNIHKKILKNKNFKLGNVYENFYWKIKRRMKKKREKIENKKKMIIYIKINSNNK